MKNRDIVQRAANDAIQTATLSSGLLNPEQAKKFIQQTFEATNLGPLVRHEMRTAKTGEIDKIGIARRIVRKKTENTDDGYRADRVRYNCRPPALGNHRGDAAREHRGAELRDHRHQSYDDTARH